MMKNRVFVLLFILTTFSLLTAQSANIYQFERVLTNQGMTITNPMLLTMRNPAGLAHMLSYGGAYYRTLDPAPGMNFLCGRWKFFGAGYIFSEDTSKTYLGLGFGPPEFSLGLSYSRGFQDIEGFEKFNAGFESKISIVTLAMNFIDINTDHYKAGFSYIDAGFSTELPWYKTSVGMDVAFSGGDEHIGRRTNLSYFVKVHVLEYLALTAKYNYTEESFTFGTDVGYFVGNLIFNGTMGDSLKTTRGYALGFEVSNRWRERQYKPGFPYSTYAKNWSWFHLKHKPETLTQKLIKTCPSAFGVLENRECSSIDCIRNVLREEYYTSKLKTDEFSQETAALSAGPRGSVFIHNVNAENHPEISLALSVEDTAGGFVSGLNKDAFSFPGDTIEIISVEEISKKNDVPVDILFVIDESGSMFNDINDLRREIYSFVNNLREGGIDFRLGLVVFGDEVTRFHEPVNDPDAFNFWLSHELKGGFREVTEDGIAKATELDFRKNSQKIIILATDEEVLQGHSENNACTLLDKLFNDGISLYQVVKKHDNNADFISWFTFGRVYNLDDNFSSILGDFQKELTQKYILKYVTSVKEEEFVEPEPEPEPEEIKVIVAGKVKDPDGNPVPATIVWENLATAEKISEIQNAPDFGTYEIEFKEMLNYGFYAKSEGYYSSSGNVDLTGITESKRIHQDIIMIPIQKLIKEKVGIILNNIFFDFDSSVLKQESYPELNRLADILKENPLRKVEISGHTDNYGSDEYNLDLSDRRAASVVAYLVSVGIEPNRLISKGYGEAVPIDTNETDEGRANNRRVEFKFIE
ncbi:OmpA family protein [bacterium]|nr:OmpA family protein [bacterium]